MNNIPVKNIFAAVFTKKILDPLLKVLDKNQVIEKVTSGKPLDEPEVRAVFRWAVEHPNEAARLSPEEKADIIRALNE